MFLCCAKIKEIRIKTKLNFMSHAFLFGAINYQMNSMKVELMSALECFKMSF